MFGYACTETPELMPMPIMMSHRLVHKAGRRSAKTAPCPICVPDGKSQVTIEYHQGKPVRVANVVVAAQHERGRQHRAQLRADVLKRRWCATVIPDTMLDSGTDYFINTTGRFVIGGPMGDSGLTGRKIIVDTYGGMVPHGGGAFSGKDPTKVDRSASYASRWVAKNVVAAGLADKCQIEIAYTIGVAHPVALNIETFGTGRIPDAASRSSSKNTLTCVPARSSATCVCAGPSISRRPPMATLAAPILTPRGEETTRADALRTAAGL